MFMRADVLVLLLNQGYVKDAVNGFSWIHIPDNSEDVYLAIPGSGRELRSLVAVLAGIPVHTPT